MSVCIASDLEQGMKIDDAHVISKVSKLKLSNRKTVVVVSCEPCDCHFHTFNREFYPGDFVSIN